MAACGGSEKYKSQWASRGKVDSLGQAWREKSENGREFFFVVPKPGLGVLGALVFPWGGVGASGQRAVSSGRVGMGILNKEKK